MFCLKYFNLPFIGSIDFLCKQIHAANISA